MPPDALHAPRLGVALPPLEVLMLLPSSLLFVLISAHADVPSTVTAPPPYPAGQPSLDAPPPEPPPPEPPPVEPVPPDDPPGPGEPDDPDDCPACGMG